MDINEIIRTLFSQESINYFSSYFPNVRVAQVANEIVSATNHASELNGDEKIASIVLAAIKLDEQNRKR